MVHDSQVLLIERRRDGHRYWVLPGGGVEPCEEPAAAAFYERAGFRPFAGFRRPRMR